LPKFQRTSNPVKIAVRAARFLGQTGYRAVNRLTNLKHEIRRNEYAVINDVFHHYRTMIYYIDPAQQLRQLREAKFVGDIRMYDLSGKPMETTGTDGTIAFVAHKRAA
jgi:hypothetical protein